MREFYREHKPRIDRLLFIAIIIAAFYLVFGLFFAYVAPFFFGLIIALVMEPLNRLLTNKIGIMRWISSVICLILFIAAFASLGVWLFSTLARQATAFVEAAPMHIAGISRQLDDANLWLDEISERLPEGVYIPPVEELVPAAAAFIFGDGMGVSGLRTIGNVGDYLLTVVLALVSAYFFMADSKKILAFCRDACPKWLLKQLRHTKTGLVRAVGGFFRAQGIIMFFVGIISVIGLMLMGSPYALLLGILFAVLDFFPVLGPGLILIPWMLLSLVMGNWVQALWLAIIYAAVIIFRHVFQPKILGTQMGAHPLATLIAIYIGFRVFGFLGLIIGPVILMIYVVLRESGDEECLKQHSSESV